MDEGKGKNMEFWLKNHNVATNSFVKGGKKNGQFFTVDMFLLGMRPQNLFLYDKKMVIRLVDRL